MADKEKLDEKAKQEKEKNDASIQPDPETLGPEPQEHMRGPVSSIIRNIAEAGDDEDLHKKGENDDEPAVPGEEKDKE